MLQPMAWNCRKTVYEKLGEKTAVMEHAQPFSLLRNFHICNASEREEAADSLRHSDAICKASRGTMCKWTPLLFHSLFMSLSDYYTAKGF